MSVKRLSWDVLALVGLVSLVVSAHARALTITDDNSTIQIDPASQAGMSSWLVDGSKTSQT